jgi:hypothetical protein
MPNQNENNSAYLVKLNVTAFWNVIVCYVLYCTRHMQEWLLYVETATD